MKHKLLIGIGSLGVIITIVSTVIFAGKQTVSLGAPDDVLSPASSTQDTQPEQPTYSNTIPIPEKNDTGEDVSQQLESLQGVYAEEVAYLDGNALYISRPNDMREKNSRRKIADNVDYVFDTRGTKALLGKNMELSEETGRRAELWVLDTLTGKEKKIADYVDEATFSPSGEMIAVNDFATGGINLFSSDGTFLQKVGTYGRGALFSPDEKKVAYFKLAKLTTSYFDIDVPGNVLGTFVYNLKTGKETLVVDDGDVAAFSPSGKKLYFNSSRGSGYMSLWVVDLESLKTKQLTDRLDPPIYQNPLMSSDGKVIASATGEGLGVLILNDQDEVVSKQFFPHGTDPYWLKQDEIIAYRAQGSKGKYWEFVSVK